MPRKDSLAVRDDLDERLGRLSERTDLPKGWHLDQALEAYLEREEHLFELLREADADFAHGRVAPNERMLEWLESWGKPDELPAPRSDDDPNR
jgi:predicted transcriptional regulator